MKLASVLTLTLALLAACFLPWPANGQVLFPGRGGTGTSTAPSYGQLLVGNGNGSYSLTATSTLGLAPVITGSTGQVAYFSNTDTLTGTSALTISSAGRVGIGATSPHSRLQIGDSTVSTSNVLTFGKYEASAEGNLPSIQQKSVIGGVSGGVGNDLALAAQSTTGGIAFYTGVTSAQNQLGTGSNAIRMAITSTGNVGIGTTTPTSRLFVNAFGHTSSLATANGLSVGSAATTVKLDIGTLNNGSGGRPFIQGNSAGSTAQDLLIQPYGGNVGIGTTTPQANLHIGSSGATLRLNTNNINTGLFGYNDGSGILAFSLTRQTVGSGSSGGVLLTAASNIGLAAGQTSTTPENAQLVLTSAGNVGIGTNNPSSALEVLGGAAGTSTKLLQLRSNSTDANTASVLRFANSTASGAPQGSAEISAIRLNSPTNGDTALTFNVYDATFGGVVETMRIHDSKVGIGTTSPAHKLEVYAATDAVLSIDSTSGTSWVEFNDKGFSRWAAGISSNSGQSRTNFSIFELGSSGNPRLTVASGGNVGIGTTSPAALLDLYSTGTTTLRIDSGHASRGSCLVMKDSDGGGYSYITTLDGVMTVSTTPCN